MEERRKSKRFTVSLKAQYFLKERKGSGKECTVININRSGAGLEFYTSEKINVSSSLLLEIFVPDSRESINVKGILRWFKKGERDFIGGIEVISKSDEEKLESLIRLTLGL